MCRSVPQTPVLSTRIRTSSLPNPGTGTSSSLRPGSAPALTSAFIAARFRVHDPARHTAVSAYPPPPAAVSRWSRTLSLRAASPARSSQPPTIADDHNVACRQWTPLHSAGPEQVVEQHREDCATSSAKSALRRPGVQQAGPFGHGGGLHPAGDAELADDVADVYPGRLGADVQLGADLGVGVPRRHEPQHR